VHVTQRDLELVRTICRFGFLTVDQVGRFWGSVDFSTAAARVRTLVDAGLIRRLELTHSTARPLLATRRGVELAGDPLPIVKGVRLATFEHDRMLFDLALALEARFSCRFETEREYRFRRPDRATDFHMPDGVLHRGKERIGIELELTQKARHRLIGIVNSHAANLDLDEAWYVVVTDAMRGYVHRIAGDAPHIKIVKWTPHQSAPTQKGIVSQ
jgi:hypothetical protein